MDGVKLIGITGGSGSGKSTVVKRIKQAHAESVLIAQDNYYKSAPFINNDNITAFNFDHPDAFDMDLMLSNLMDLKEGRSCMMPQYDFVHHRRKEESVLVEPQKLIIIDGLMIFYDKRIRDLLDLKLYVDTPADIRFIRRLQRDIKERGRTLESVIEQYVNVVRPGHMSFIEPAKEYADLIIPEGGYNENAMNVLFTFVKAICQE
ncbi:MAG: uridine kinase [Candidatus Ornithospirochaeta sp.]|nr:uridine kinase [Candidatus Ornithospirochaeta sp.]